MAQAGKVSIEDRLDIHDMIARYAWALDTGDVDGYCACFTDDAWIFHGPDGKLQGRAGLKQLTEQLWYAKPDHYLGRQHRMSQVLLSYEGADIRIKAFWSILQQRVATGECFVFGLGTWDGLATKVGGEWQLKSLYVDIWRGRNVPWVGDARAGETTKAPTLPY
jgi:3-phenylpropionate/cinnamic acid dioxygenase small subunit